jgi:hypothetical protein
MWSAAGIAQTGDAELAEQLDAATAEEQPVGEHEPTEALPVFLCNSDDPYVMLDEAKLNIGEGKLRRATAMLAIVDSAAADPHVREELLFQRLLLTGAFLSAAGSVLKDAQNAGYGDSQYAAWLRVEGAQYASVFSALATEWLAETQEELDCDFVRFRLPSVTADHLSDAVLYSDPQVLRAAVQNWEQDKQGLGKGLIGTQARVALVLGAATFYDLPSGARTLEAVSSRLESGVPIDSRIVYDWLAQTAWEQREVGGTGLQKVQEEVDQRLAKLLQVPGSLLRQRYENRNLKADLEKSSRADTGEAPGSKKNTKR